MRWAVLAVLLGLICLREPTWRVQYSIRAAAAPLAFNLVDWEVRALAERLGPLVEAMRGELQPADGTNRATVRDYFQTPSAARAGLRAGAEGAIQRLVTDTWRAEGLVLPSFLAGGESAVFPPVSFVFTDPPRVLIVSPRDRIKVEQYVLLRPSLSLSEIQTTEDSVARRGVSSLVTPIGGLATYPTMVLDDGPAEAVLGAVAHEWAHAYFFFYPLGRGYWSDQDLRTINETAADLAGAELGKQLARQLDLPSPPRAGPPTGRQSEFSRILRETRLEVDRLLAAGQVDVAEQYMEQRRLELNARAYQLRRLNQAYFAFFSSYAEGPAGTSPLAGQVRRLRERSGSLGEFLRSIARVSSPDDLARLAAGG